MTATQEPAQRRRWGNEAEIIVMVYGSFHGITDTMPQPPGAPHRLRLLIIRTNDEKTVAGFPPNKVFTNRAQLGK
jgi:hypothetical protein